MTSSSSEAPPNIVGRGLGWSTASNIVLRVGNLLTSILMAHLIAPKEFGLFAVALTVWVLLGTLAEFGLGTDLIRARDPEPRIPTVATLGLLSSGVFAATMFLSSDLIAGAFQSPSASGLIKLMAVSLVLFGFTIVPSAMLQRAFRQAALFLVNLLGLIASTTTMATLALLDFGPEALAWGQIANQTVLVVGTCLASRVRLRLGFVPSIAKDSALFCLPLASANLLSWLLLSVDTLLVARMLGPQQLGLYALAFNVSSWPMSALGQAIRVVALPGFAQIESESRRNNALVLIGPPVWSVSILVGVSLAALAPALISVLYGDRWIGAAIPLGALAIFGAFRVIFDVLATFLIAVGEPVQVFLIQVVWLVAMVPAMFFGISKLGLFGAGLAHILVAVVVVLPSYLYCLSKRAIAPRAFFKGWILPTVVAIPVGIACWVTVTTTRPALLALALGGIVASCLYLAPMAPWLIRRMAMIRNVETVIHKEKW